MDELKKKISALVWNYFEEKICGFNFYGDNYEEELVQDMIEKCEDNVCEALRHTDRDIDDELKSFDVVSAKRRFVVDMKLDQMYEDAKDRSLGLL